MYVRTKKGIAKVTMLDYLDNVAWTDNKNIFFGITSDDYLTWYVDADGMVLSKPSFNLIDLIEVGDYVNGEKVTETMIKMRDEQGVFGLPDHYRTFVDEIHIKSVVTKEQFESIKYEVK